MRRYTYPIRYDSMTSVFILFIANEIMKDKEWCNSKPDTTWQIVTTQKKRGYGTCRTGLEYPNQRPGWNTCH